MAYGRLSPEDLQAARFASHLLFWDRNTRFCGVCGAPTTDKPDERAKICTDPPLRFRIYPKISPAVIVAILDRDRILLAHNRRFVSKFYSLIAGFVEIGESLEDCVHREVKEEVGVKVKNIRYFGSQPWPTPDSLMIGFLADYAGGDIRIQDDELHDARWFSPPDMPTLPPSDSIARRILRWYETEYVPFIRGKGRG
jgi:NAD+ diphosphatase